MRQIIPDEQEPKNVIKVSQVPTNNNIPFIGLQSMEWHGAVGHRYYLGAVSLPTGVPRIAFVRPNGQLWNSYDNVKEAIMGITSANKTHTHKDIMYLFNSFSELANWVDADPNKN